ncbi:thiolase family protein [Trueperella bialowiezensis]|uniref:Probable acetyl-CoA acetyltransferase n=1 Tax=Trueperella bialowiezensis TaxID=312285 RepID=A0A448PDM1_9ACTO|nr:thiolase family protein [Trueperella bialowiezensis]VEI13022.1 Beta-ketoadipyl-CoA thiolase [Trueperella bialowiezensis]
MSAFIYDAVRTPFGKFGRALATVRPDDMLATTLSQLLARHPDLDPARVDEVIAGNANGAGEENRDVARMSWLLAGLPVSVPGVTVNRLCGSGVESVIQAARAVETGDATTVIACGVESMTRAPWVMLKPERAYPAGGATLESTSLGWRLVNPNMPKQYTVALGEGAEILAERYAISRTEQDEFATRSHRLATEAWDAGRYDAEIVSAGVDLERDETIRPDTSVEGLAKLRTAFRKENGTVTAGNASSLNDGAAAMIVGDESLADTLGTPLARIVSRGASGVSPEIFGIGPVESANIALKRAGLTWDDIDLVELNEAFAAQALACLREWKDLDPEKVNVDGGAIAIGHPLGASGGRIVGHLAHSLKARGLRYGLASICIGVGQGLSIIIERA